MKNKLLKFLSLTKGFRIALFLAYIKCKILRKSLTDEQTAVIHYFNFLLKNNLKHILMREHDNLIRDNKYGILAMRKFPTSDYAVFKQCCVDNEYGELVQLIHKLIPKGRITMIDGGANIGLTSIALRVNLGSRYDLESILVEPFEDNINQIYSNLSLQKINNFTILKAGITNKKVFLDFDFSYRDVLEWSVQIVETLVPTDLRSVEIVEILNNNDWEVVDILKLDIEGSERNLFEDEIYAKNFLCRVRILAIEIHEEYIKDDVVLKILENEGFVMSRHGELYIGYNLNLF